MKFTLFLLALLTSTLVYAEDISCRSMKAIQNDEPGGMKVDSELIINLDRETKIISKVVGHIFVQQSFIEDEPIGVENSYLGFFYLDSVASNPNYRPTRYKGYTQFKDFDATHTAGHESGMWGEFVMDLTKSTETFDARYIFQAGDHMGGTVLFTCRRL